MRKAASLLLLVALSGFPEIRNLAANPVPPYRPKPPPAVVAGEYTLSWGGVAGQSLTLRKDGTHRLAWLGRDWLGTWRWDAPTRTLHFRDTGDGGATWYEWTISCGPTSLAGRSRWADQEAEAALVPRKP